MNIWSEILTFLTTEKCCKVNWNTDTDIVTIITPDNKIWDFTVPKTNYDIQDICELYTK